MNKSYKPVRQFEQKGSDLAVFHPRWLANELA
jgi:hypothetical protein